MVSQSGPMLRRILVLVAAVAVVVAAPACRSSSSSAPAAGSAAAARDRIAGWRDDLHTLADQLPARHKNAFFQVDEAAWRHEVAELDHRIPTATDAQVIAGLAHLVAMIGDSHTTLIVGARGGVYPVKLYTFADGTFVTGAPPDAAWAVGRRLVSIDGMPVADATAKLAPLISHDTHQMLRAQLPQALVQASLLAGTGVARAADHATFRLAAADGTARDLPLHASLVSPTPRLPASLPLYLQHPGWLYWNTYDAGQKLIYLQYNACEDRADLPFARFAAETLAFADGHPVDHFVVDLRMNGGGDSRVIQPLLDGIDQRPLLRGHVVALIGRSTFSSALMAAIELKRRGATLVGEPTGGKPSSYGEVKRLSLPSSGLVVQYSTKYFSYPELPADSLRPDVEVHLTSADWFAGRDPVLDAAVAASAHAVQ
jgi:hypothetical protein